MKKRIFILAGLLTSILLSSGNMTVYAKQPSIVSTAINDAAPYSINYEWSIPVK